MTETEQARHLTLIEQYLREVEEYPLVREVQTWLHEQHDIDLPLDLVRGNMQIVRQWMHQDEETHQ